MTENERVRYIRKKLGLTQDEFGKKIGVQKTAISKIEIGENGVSEQMRLLICNKFNVNENWLRDEQGDIWGKKNISDMDKLISELPQKPDSPEYKTVSAFLSVYARLSPESKAAIMKLAEEVSKEEKGK